MSVNNINCCVFGCHSKKGRNTELSFHKFPEKHESAVYVINGLGVTEKVDKHKAWMLKLNMGKPASKYMKVCSRHFKEDDFILPSVPTKRPRLKATAVPSKNLPQKSIPPKVNQPRKCRKIFLSEQENNTENMPMPQSFQNNDIPAETHVIQPCGVLENRSTIEQEAALVLLSLQHDIVSKKDQGTQVSSGDFVIPFASTITTDKELNTMTGIPTFVLFNTIVSHCEEMFGTFSNKNKLSLSECALLTCMKLKNSFSYAVLSVLFKSVTAVTCRRIFHETLIMLAKVLSPAIYWPTIEEIKLNMPICFQSFQRARIVIDCTEIPVQRAKSLKCRIRTYSHYKKGHTIKYMTAVTPAGLISFVSKGYGGRCSDKVIFEQSGLVENLEMCRDEIMVDKGFLIQDITDNHCVKVIQPPFLKKQIQFTKGHALLNQKIAKARVHIERVNQRIKIFDIFKKPLPVSLWPRVDDIFIIVCAVVNLSNSVLDDCRFLQDE